MTVMPALREEQAAAKKILKTACSQQLDWYMVKQGAQKYVNSSLPCAMNNKEAASQAITNKAL